MVLFTGALTTTTGQTEQEMFLRIFRYTDQLYKLVNPKRLMYLAVDGVALRAKRNQQRARRFRAAKDRPGIVRIGSNTFSSTSSCTV